jgi:hypothetical protein
MEKVGKAEKSMLITPPSDGFLWAVEGGVRLLNVACDIWQVGSPPYTMI